MIELDQLAKRIMPDLDQQSLTTHAAGHPALHHESQTTEHPLLRLDLAAEQVADPPCQALVVCHAQILQDAADTLPDRSAHTVERDRTQWLEDTHPDATSPFDTFRAHTG